MINQKIGFLDNLTDEQILKEFVKRFKCDGAVLIYLDNNTENGLGRWCNPIGQKWVKHILKITQKNTSLNLTELAS